MAKGFAFSGTVGFAVLVATQCASAGESGKELRTTVSKGSADYRDTVDRFLRKKMPKIVGGQVAPPGAYPWQVSLVVSWIANPAQGHFCGGSIIDQTFILTAAHCVVDNEPRDINVVAGTNVLSESARRINVARISYHSRYDKVTKDNDIALLQLWEPLELQGATQAIDLLTAADEEQLAASDKIMAVTGWGATEEGGRPVRDLRHIPNLPIVDRNRCDGVQSYRKRITQNMICAGRPTGGVDSCQGDSGGPLAAASAKPPRLVGVVSWGDGCALPFKYGVYTRVARYGAWIDGCRKSAANC